MFSAHILRKILPFQESHRMVHVADPVSIYGTAYFMTVIAFREVTGRCRRPPGANTTIKTYVDPDIDLENLLSAPRADLPRDRLRRPAARQLAATFYHLLDGRRAKRRLCYLRRFGETGLIKCDIRFYVTLFGVCRLWRWDECTFVQKLSASVGFSSAWVSAGSLIGIGVASGERSRGQKSLLKEASIPAAISV